jgi:N-acylneuraminate cytidylyltransferase
MKKHMDVLAIVPARGDSKSIPRKNIRPFAGHPLLAYSIAAGRQATLVTRILLSTDDAEIRKIGVGYGAEAPFLRPADLALDETRDLPVFLHALEWLEHNEDYRPEVVVHLRPTSPVRRPGLIDDAVQKLLAHPEADSVRSVIPSEQNPYKTFRIGPAGYLAPILQDGPAEAYDAPRQSLPATYWHTGTVDVVRRATLLEKRSMSGTLVLPIELDPRCVVDIDTPSQWEHAEWLMQHGDLQAVRPEPAARRLPAPVEWLILDFDGVMTDNRVWVDSDGRESVAAHRGDGMGLALLRQHGVQVAVLSTETDPVVAARCRKLGLPVIQGLQNKAAALQGFLKEQGGHAERAVYLGNDVNDVPCFPIVGYAFVVADAHPDAAARADAVLRASGGQGAVRELCDLLIRSLEENTHA